MEDNLYKLDMWRNPEQPFKHGKSIYCYPCFIEINNYLVNKYLSSETRVVNET